MKAYATGDQKLNNHIFGNLVLKEIDFSSPEVYAMFRGPKRPTNKQEIFNYQMEKLRIMLHFYSTEDFEAVKFHKLNSD